MDGLQSNEMAHSIYQLAEARRNGCVSGGKFYQNVCSALGENFVGGVVKLEYSRAFVQTDDYELDIDIKYNRLILYNASGTIFLYDVAPRINRQPYKIMKIIKTTSGVLIIPPKVRWNLDCSYFTISGGGHQLTVYDATSFEVMDNLSEPSELVFCHELHPFTPGMIASGMLGAVKIIDLRTAATDKLILQKDCNRSLWVSPSAPDVDTAKCVTWSPEDERVLVCSSERTNYIFDIRHHRKPLRVFEYRKRGGIVDYPCTKFVDRFVIASAHCHRFLGLYDINTTEQTFLEPAKAKSPSPAESWIQPARRSQTFDYDPDGGHIYLGHGNEIFIYDLKKAKFVHILKGHLFEVMKLKFNELSKELFSFAGSFQCTVWSPKHYSPSV